MAYVDKAKLMQRIETEAFRWGEEYDLSQIMGDIEDFPESDVVEVKRGHFVRNERNIPKMKEFHEKGVALSMSEKSIFYTCSECGEWISLSQKYCSECGAKMDGGKEE